MQNRELGVPDAITDDGRSKPFRGSGAAVHAFLLVADAIHCARRTAIRTLITLDNDATIWKSEISRPM